MAGTSPVNVLTLQLTTPLALPVSEQISAPGAATQGLDLINLPWVSLQAAMDSLRSIATTSQPSLVTLMAEGQLSTVAPIGTITYTASSGAQTVTIGGVAVSPAPVTGTSDATQAANTAAAINASLNHNQYVFATVLAATPTVVQVQGRLPGTGLNTVAFAVTGTGAAVSAATLGGSGAGQARAGVAWSQNNVYGIGTPLFP